MSSSASFSSFVWTDVKFYRFLFPFPILFLRSLEDFNFTWEAWNFKLFRYTWKNDGRWDILMKEEGMDSIHTHLIWFIRFLVFKLKCLVSRIRVIWSFIFFFFFFYRLECFSNLWKIFLIFTWKDVRTSDLSW